MITTRPCFRCHAPLVPDRGILEDARRAEITLAFLPLRCPNAHTERLPLEPQPRVRYVPTCGYCERPVFDRSPHGKQLMNHPTCTGRAHTSSLKPHRYVEVPG